MKKVLIAMSGGVDSSVTASVLKENNYQCIGATMKLFESEETEERAKSCCSLSDVEDAKSVCMNLGMRHYTFDFMKEFSESVISNFISSYENGSTPNPCVECNRFLKFDKLLLRARELGYDYIATGHYAIVEEKDGRFLLKKGVDSSKDQSYVLYFMTQDQLAHTLFPLGNLQKTEVRKIAEEHHFYNAHKKDSQDICFVPNGKYGDVICAYAKHGYPEGDFISTDNEILGKHKGFIHYTKGQRKGLGISSPHPLYVVDKNKEENTVILGREQDLYSDTLIATNFNWIYYDTPPTEFRAKAKARYKQEEEWATIYVLDQETVKVKFDNPQRALTAGQIVVLYHDDYVVGGGYIKM